MKAVKLIFLKKWRRRTVDFKTYINRVNQLQRSSFQIVKIQIIQSSLYVYIHKEPR